MPAGGFKTFTAGSVLTASDVNAYLMQGVLVFASTTARDAAVTSPQRGMVCYISSNDANEGFYTYNGTSWRARGWNDAWGVIGSSTRTSNQSSITSITDITGHSITFTAVANRNYLIQAMGLISCTASSSYVDCSIREGSTYLGISTIAVASSTYGQGYAVQVYKTFTAGSHTVKFSVQQLAGAGAASFLGSADAPATMILTDCGPSGAPS